MPQASAGGKVFISYRREHAAPQAGRLYDNLSARLGEERVFMDVDSIGLGLDFVQVIQDAVSSCEVLIALIGREWLNATDENGRRRLDDPDDFVRLEIEAALQRNVRVVPILLNDAVLPEPEDLPPGLRALTRRQALQLSDATFRSDVRRLIEQLERVITVAPGVGDGSSADSPRAPEKAWAAQVIEKKWYRRVINLKLTEEAHVLTVEVGWADSIKLGDRIVWRESTGDSLAGDHPFAVSDGGVVRGAVLSVKSAFGGLRIEGVDLRVEDKTLLVDDAAPS